MFEFGRGDVDEVLAAMRELTAAQHGWITLLPGVFEDDAPPPQSLLGRLFSGTGPAVPVCTWVAPQPKQRPPHAELGVLHKSGPKAVARLAGVAIAVPEHWVVLADHPRRGLVIAVHPESPLEETLEFLLDAGEALTVVPLTGMWQATVHE